MGSSLLIPAGFLPTAPEPGRTSTPLTESNDGGPAAHPADLDDLPRLGGPGSGGRSPVNITDVVGAILVLASLIYLFAALLNPERFS